jgi:hypothetical protein
MCDHEKLAFALRGCRDLLEKLRYETGSLNTTERHDVMGRAYIAFNCAVTAWHMTDWVWVELNQSQREKVQTLAGTSCKLVAPAVPQEGGKTYHRRLGNVPGAREHFSGIPFPPQQSPLVGAANSRPHWRPRG